MAVVRQQLAQMEAELKQASWLERDILIDLQMLFEGFHGGLDELEFPYTDLQEFISYNLSKNNTAILRKSMGDLVRRTWRDGEDFDQERLFLIVRMYGNIARLDSNFSLFLDSRVSKIQGRLDAMVEGRFRWYGIGQAGLGTILIFLVILLMRRLSDLYKESLAAKEVMAELSMRDTLTDLPNRRTLADLFPHLLERVKLRGIGFCLMLLEVDNFKGVNDTLGHAAGDLLLKTLAQRMTELLRKPAVIVRWGGDEFVILLPDTFEISDAQTVAHRLLTGLAEPIDFHGQSLEFTTSIGIAQCPLDGDSLEAILHSADLAMYEAKKQGKNTFALCAQNLQPAKG
jgi:diguanylate cyclase (GGDEF)-like protein